MFPSTCHFGCTVSSPHPGVPSGRQISAKRASAFGFRLHWGHCGPESIPWYLPRWYLEPCVHTKSHPEKVLRDLSFTYIHLLQSPQGQQGPIKKRGQSSVVNIRKQTTGFVCFTTVLIDSALEIDNNDVACGMPLFGGAM